nr:hypothetical protein [Tanacetum cinerariifolium]
MSDSEDSIIIYTAVSSPYGGLSDIGSPRVDGPPVMPEDPYAYVVAAFQAPPSPDYPLPAAASPTAESPGYIDESDPEDDPEEDPEEDHVDYPIDGGEEGDDEDESSDDKEDEEGSTYSAIEIGYGITDTWDDLVGAIQETASTTVEGVTQRVTELSTTFDRETSMIYAMIEERQDDQVLQRARINRLFRDRRFHAHTARLMEGEARASRTAWTQSMDASDAACSGVIAFRGDQGVAGRTLQATCTLHSGTDCTEVMSDSADCRSRTHSDLRDRQSPTIARGTGGGRMERVTRECTYPDFMKCKPLNFKGTEGVVELTQWSKKMETVFRISNCSVDMKKKMTDKYCPRGEMKKLESKLWNLKVKSNDVRSHNQRFQALALLYVRMFLEEADKIERYVGGLPDVIHGSVVASSLRRCKRQLKWKMNLLTKGTTAGLNTRLKTKEKLMTLSEAIKANSNNKTRGKIPAGFTLLDLVKNNHTEGLNLCALSATITTMVHVPRNATSATKLATLL